jgi:membrane associated rhomboid family serine protease
MLVVPLGLEGRGMRRIPLVTLGLILVNALAFVVTWALGSSRVSNAAVLGDLIEQTLTERPYVVVSERLARALDEQTLATAQDARATWEASGASLTPEQRDHEQKHFDALADDYLAALDRLPWRRFGFIPARRDLVSLLTSMFMHAGWIHLLGNMLFLYASGPYVEDVYGRLLFAVAYLLSGIAATAGQTLASPQSDVPLVGASGAIAGVMGIVLVRLATSWVRFLFLPIVFVPTLRIYLKLPALVVLPLWALEQLWYAGSASSETGGGVAWWAHLAGFGFGAVFAALVRLLHVEDRWLGRSMEADESVRALENAATAREEGALETAHRELERAREADPDGADVWREAYELALVEQDAPVVARAMARLLELLPRRGETAEALALVEDGRWAEVPGMPARLHFSVAGFLERQGQIEGSLGYYQEVMRTSPGDVLSLRAAIRKGELQGRTGQTAAARATLTGAQAHPALNAEWRAAIERALARLNR